MSKTQVYSLEDFETAVDAAAAALKSGKIAAFPTETVYGLGASIFDENAVLKIYEAKGRAPEKPLSVLISSADEMEKIAAVVPKNARKLAECFWPGPLTIILKKKAEISDKITAGKETVGLRVPAHPAALEIVRRAGPLACPSANLSDSREPKSAADVLADLDGQIDLLIDGGKTQIQKPSTIVDLTVEPPRILRKGGLEISEIKKCIGEVLE
ncbi:Threonylcarbamoyl-AMP synthase [Methanimicrococcus hongohii]|uniref:L-threonylcarbamoyladenylate synthase n=1 Tax=Methanimicrococcus hongohii TaxID=3028295 RepID=A0AA96V0E5_9EURY|nr:L-threonylcarbamoyladenylate synthase [Methanimicrococcus sp. Hf6]WNY24084.1 Threonylcarbamoyl-AMP synthase [Methanimicrococcus sp. Hf6]